MLRLGHHKGSRLIGLITTLLFLCTSCHGVMWIFSDPLPLGIGSQEAELLTDQISLNLEAHQFAYAEGARWSYAGHDYLWHRSLGRVRVDLNDQERIYLSLLNPQESKVLIGDTLITGERADELVDEAIAAFNNDSFWAFAPFKLRDPGTQRSIIQTDKGPALLVEYQSGGTTPGDRYLWHIDAQGRPYQWQMWVSLIPIGGLKATWENWEQTQSGAWIARCHNIVGVMLCLTNLEVTRSFHMLSETDHLLTTDWSNASVP